MEEQIRSLLEKMESAARIGVDWIQIREKDLSGRELAALVDEKRCGGFPRPCRILVNDRLDVAMAVGAGGVHLGKRACPSKKRDVSCEERNFGEDFLVGVSAHSLEGGASGAQSGADYVIFGPVYETPSKAAYGPPQGTERLVASMRDRVRSR